MTATTAHPVVSAIRELLSTNACQADAQAVQRYMKSEQPFYGVKSPLRRKLIAQALQAHPIESVADYESVVAELWGGVYRDEQYAALDIAERLKAFRTPARWDLYVQLLESASWWDTLDWIATRLVSPLLLEDPSKRSVAARWIEHDSVWMRRAALLVHLKHREETDVRALAEAIVALIEEESFWIRKAIGWVLRSYGATNPEWVRVFVAAHPELSTLSKREALKHL